MASLTLVSAMREDRDSNPVLFGYRGKTLPFAVNRLHQAKRKKERKPGLAFGPMDSRNDDDTILPVNATMIERPLFFFLKKGIMSMLAGAFKPSHVYL